VSILEFGFMNPKYNYLDSGIQNIIIWILESKNEKVGFMNRK
jgi:hypothetical protein